MEVGGVKAIQDFIEWVRMHREVSKEQSASLGEWLRDYTSSLGGDEG